MEEYNILNSIKPSFLRTKYPYNFVNPEKIVIMQKKIPIMVKELKAKVAAVDADEEKTGGSYRVLVHYYE